MSFSTPTRLLTVFIALLFHIQGAQATSVKQTMSAEKFEDHQLVQSASISLDDKTDTTLLPVSHGLRKKAVFGLVAVDVYTLQLLAAKPDKLVKTSEGILASLKEAGPVQLNIVFLRNIPGDKISESFKEGLEVNGVDPKKLSPELQQVMDAISAISKFPKGGSFTLTFTWSGTGSAVHLQEGSGAFKSFSGSADFAGHLLAIWFGKPADSKLGELKKTLLK